MGAVGTYGVCRDLRGQWGFMGAVGIYRGSGDPWGAVGIYGVCRDLWGQWGPMGAVRIYGGSGDLWGL